jgi:hypothetical protein
MGSTEHPAPDYLATYLRDHRAGAAGGLSLFQRAARANADTELGPLLRQLTTEVEDDCAALEAIMERLGVQPHWLKVAIAPVAERVGRLKLNRHLFRYSPLSRVVELELLIAGVETKRNGWRSLFALAERHEALDQAQLAELIERASSQILRLRDAHRSAATDAFAT